MSQIYLIHPLIPCRASFHKSSNNIKLTGIRIDQDFQRAKTKIDTGKFKKKVMICIMEYVLLYP